MDRYDGILFMEALIYIASADDNLDDSEIGFFNKISEEIGLSTEEIDEICREKEQCSIGLEEILSEIESTETKMTLLRMLLELCHVDGKYSAEEKEGMKNICGMLGIEVKELKKLEVEYFANEGKRAIKKGYGTIKTGVVFAGGKSIQGGKFVASKIAKGLGKVNTKLSDAMANAKKLREENKKLREELKGTTINESVKQKIILKLNAKVSALTDELKREKARNDQNEEIIRLLKEQLEDLELTLEVAEATKTA